MTPHNEAKVGDYAPIVLMPGDPLRAKWIAETYFDNPILINSVRNCLGYTGMYKGQPVSVQASGMGQPSLGIYAHELYNTYNVDKIIRVGSCGGISDHVHLNDIVVAMTACTDSSMTANIIPGFQFAPCADYQLLHNYVRCIPNETRYWVGSITSNDYFYQPQNDWWKKMADVGILAVEMETHVLYSLAMRFKKKALAVNTVSDHLNGKHKPMSPNERQTGFETMIIATLESIL
jgi:purine-nucleoside phosphorylase